MKTLLIVFSLGVAAASMADPMVAKWTQMKIFENCFGKEITMEIFSKMKEAKAKCYETETLGLEDVLMLQSPMVIQKFLEGGKAQQLELVNQMMKGFGEQPPQTFSPYPMTKQGEDLKLQFSAVVPSKVLMKVVESMGMSRMPRMPPFQGKGPGSMRRRRGHHGKRGRGYGRGCNDFNDVFGDSSGEGGYPDEGDPSGGIDFEDVMEALTRGKRASGDDDVEGAGGEEDDGIVERLADKLQKKQMKMKEKIGNASCVMQEMHVIDADRNIDLPGMLEDLDTYDIKDEWLVEKAKQITRSCAAAAESMPKEYHMPQFDEKWARAMTFFKCFAQSQMNTCMNLDVKRRLEETIGPISKLAEGTGLSEATLLSMAELIL